MVLLDDTSQKGRKEGGGWEGMKRKSSPFLLFQNKRVVWAPSSPFWTTTIWSNKNHDSFRIRITWRPWSKGKKKWGSPNRRLLNFDNQAEKKDIKSPLFPPKFFFLLLSYSKPNHQYHPFYPKDPSHHHCKLIMFPPCRIVPATCELCGNWLPDHQVKLPKKSEGVDLEDTNPILSS